MTARTSGSREPELLESTPTRGGAHPSFTPTHQLEQGLLVQQLVLTDEQWGLLLGQKTP
jgi:hypothetical protein